MTAALFAGGTVAAAEGCAGVAGGVAPVPGAGRACVDCGAIADGSRTALALVQGLSASAASTGTGVACDRFICLKPPWRTPSRLLPLWIHCTIKSRSWRDSGLGCDSVV